ncbi:MAG: hypothetical protein GC149_17355 [Gammaproteobacteria bacterium]|nr:hypothetical protein [Gammaproteobacteria bacterium]
MGYLRNLLIFAAFSIIVTACGGGNTTITGNGATSSSSGSSGTTGGTSSGGGTTSGGGSTSGGTTTTGSVTLKWTAPTTRSDNTAVSLSDISGYRLYYGSAPTDTPNYVNITDGTATQQTISLPSGSYYFRISAIDSSGYEGLKSTAVQKTL